MAGGAAAWGGAGGDRPPRVTVVVTTSPVRSHPETRLLEETLASARAFAAGLAGCPVVVVCDGYKVGARSRHRSGIIAPEEESRYAEYRARLAILARTPGSAVHGAEILCLPCKHGFPYALRRGLQHVHTPYVLVMQHDRAFVRPTDLQPVLRAMAADPRLRYVGFPTTTTLHHARHVKNYGLRLEMETVEGAKFLPLVQWYDSTHLASTEHYMRFVYGRDRRVNFSRSGFVEDRLGQAQLADIRQGGMSAHAAYGTWLYFDGGGEEGGEVEKPSVGHIDGHDTLTADGRCRKYHHRHSHTAPQWWGANLVKTAVEASRAEIAAHLEGLAGAGAADGRRLWQDPVPPFHSTAFPPAGSEDSLPPWCALAESEGNEVGLEGQRADRQVGAGGAPLYVDADLPGWKEMLRESLGCTVEPAPVCVIVPFREDASGKREGQLAEFLHAMDAPAFRDFLVLVVEQSADRRRFNRGQLLNAGYRWLVRACATPNSHAERWLMSHKPRVGLGKISPDQPLGRTLLAFHDVDMPPSAPGLRAHYRCSPEGDRPWVKVVEANWQRYASQGCFGGVTLFRAGGFEAANGFPNSFWGWGGEDNALYARIVRAGASILRVRGGVFQDLEGLSLEQKLEALKSDNSMCQEKRWLLTRDKGAWLKDGLSDLDFEVKREVSVSESAIRVQVELRSGGAEKLECGFCMRKLDPRQFKRTKDFRGLEYAKKKAQMGKLRCIECTEKDDVVKTARENAGENAANPARRTCEMCKTVFSSRSALFRHLGDQGCGSLQAVSK